MAIKQVETQNVDKQTQNIWVCFNNFILAFCYDSLTKSDVNNFIVFNMYIFSVKQAVIEIIVLDIIVVYFSVKYYFTENYPK